MIEVVELKQCNFAGLYVGSNLGIIGSVIYQQDGKTFHNHKLLGEKLNDEILLQNENSASVNDVFIIILRTYNKVTSTSTTTQSRLLQVSERILETGSPYGTLYISNKKVSENGEPAPFNWLMFVVIPLCGLVGVGFIGFMIWCLCCRKGTSESISPPKKNPAETKPKTSKPIESESQRTIHDGSSRDVVQPIYMPSDRSLGGKPIPLDSRKDIPKTQENSFISTNTANNPPQPRDDSSENHYGITPDRTPDRTPNRTPDRTPDMTPERRSLDNKSQENGGRTPSKSPRRRRRRRAR